MPTLVQISAEHTMSDKNTALKENHTATCILQSNCLVRN